MTDIETREDILLIMRKFYDKLFADDSINFFFTKVTSVDQHLEAHFEILATFWEQSLFLKGGYFNNMFSIHKEVHDKHAFTKEHFDTWISHFNLTIDEHFEGKYAEQMKTQALSMATIMQIKFN
ncbi:group III truncated hemoglobin [Flavobacterium cyclinae]|uniref:group III truncated hemoglobin n=1 Tax=Flavobacterium cyclinae TaxID=2895947 RepID=UPI001E48E4A9|nr:group III truncated hemoglobin [Flavobacterium cyclinae]UGS20695.1 group III truncated hemoglobin [Flavobacterium cyclinae]